MGDHSAGGLGDAAGFPVAVIVVTLVVGIFGPTANGDRFALFQIVDATVASTVIVRAAHRGDLRTGCRGGRCRVTELTRDAADTGSATRRPDPAARVAARRLR